MSLLQIPHGLAELADEREGADPFCLSGLTLSIGGDPGDKYSCLGSVLSKEAAPSEVPVSSLLGNSFLSLTTTSFNYVTKRTPQSIATIHARQDLNSGVPSTILDGHRAPSFPILPSPLPEPEPQARRSNTRTQDRGGKGGGEGRSRGGGGRKFWARERKGSAPKPRHQRKAGNKPANHKRPPPPRNPPKSIVSPVGEAEEEDDGEETEPEGKETEQADDDSDSEHSSDDTGSGHSDSVS